GGPGLVPRGGHDRALLAGRRRVRRVPGLARVAARSHRGDEAGPMRFLDLLRSAGIEIRAHKVRSALTCVSLSIGVAAALYTLSQIGSIGRRYEGALRVVGPGRLQITRKSGYIPKGLSKGLTLGDARALRAMFPELYMVSPVVARGEVKFRDGAFRSKNVRATGVTEEW